MGVVVRGGGTMGVVVSGAVVVVAVVVGVVVIVIGVVVVVPDESSPQAGRTSTHTAPSPTSSRFIVQI